MQPALFELHAELEEKHWWFRGRRHIMLQLVHQVLPAGENATVIDIGCGTGANIAALAAQYRCIGIDQSEEGIQFARQRFADVDFICASLPIELPPHCGPRLFLLMDVIEHIEDETFLSQVVDMMEADDHLLLTVPADMSLWSEHDVSFGHYRRYDIDQLQAVWTDLPVEQRLLSYFNTRLYPLVKLFRTLGRLRGGAWGASGTDLKMPAPAVNNLLERFFGGEAKRLIALLKNNDKRGYKRGVSLIALLRKTEPQS
jgi:SAM-dependent methyltransferase